MVLRIKWGGDLSELGAEWEGWHFHQGTLTSPDGWTISRNDALAVPLLHGQISALRAELSKLKAEANGLEEQPEPGEIPAIRA
jgi:hypothetical protein